jgi:hypothetical protein
MRGVHDHLPFFSQLEEIIKRLKQRRANSSLHTGLHNSFEAVNQTADERGEDNQYYFYV